MGKVDGIDNTLGNKGFNECAKKDSIYGKFSDYADEYNLQVNASANMFSVFSGTTIATAGLGVSAGKGNFFASATTFAGSQYKPKQFPWSYTTVGTDYLYPGQDKNKVKLSLGTWSGYTYAGASQSGFIGVIPARLKCELPKDSSLTVSPIFERFYSNESKDKNQLVVNTMLSVPITKNLSWYICHWLFDVTRQPKKSANHEIDTGLMYTF